MKKMLPSGVELAVLFVMAVLAAGIFATIGQDRAMVLFTFPLLLTGMLLGARRSGKLGAAEPAAIKQSVEQPAN